MVVVSSVLAHLRALSPAALVAGSVAAALGVALAVAVVVVVLRAASVAVGLARWRVHAQGARLVWIAVPARVDPHAAEAWWTQVLGLLAPDPSASFLRHRRRPRRQRRPWWAGQPWLAFEYLSTAARHRVRVWVPGTVPPGLVEQAVQAAWPGARTHTETTPEPASLRVLLRAELATHRHRHRHDDPDSEAGSGRGQRVSAGGVLRLARPAGLPIATLTAALPGQRPQPADPVRALFTAAESPDGLQRGDAVLVQVLARPLSAAAMLRATRATRAAHPGVAADSAAGRALGVVARGLGGLLLVVLRELLDLVMPGPSATRRATTSRSATSTGAATGAVAGSRAGASALTGPERYVRSAADRAVAAKSRGGAGYATVIRYAATTPAGSPGASPVGRVGGEQAALDRAAPEQSVQAGRVRARAHAVAGVFAAFGDLNHYRRRRLPRADHALEVRRLPGRGDALSVAELAAIAHLPHDPAIPRLDRAGAAVVAPHPEVPTRGPGVIPLGSAPSRHHHDGARTGLTPGVGADARTGTSVGVGAGPAVGHAAEVVPAGERPVGLRVDDAMMHTHVLGLTGAGKSTYLAGRALSAVNDGRGLVFIDPRGDAMIAVLSRLTPEQRRPWGQGGRLLIIDPQYPGRPPVLNPLAPHRIGSTGFAIGAGAGGGTGDGDAAGPIEHTLGVFARLFSRYWGPRTDDLMRVAALTVAHDPDRAPTLAGIARLLLDHDHRARLLDHLPDPTTNRDGQRTWRRAAMLHDFWADFDAMSDGARAQTTAPLLNKLRSLLLRNFASDVLSGGASTVDLAEVLDQGGIVLVRLPKGALGEENARLLGSLILAQTWQAVTTRARLDPHLRRPAEVIVDEAHNFLNLPENVDDMLAEARGYRAGLTLAHQHLGQLPPALRDGVIANTRNKMYFALSDTDARALAGHTRPELDVDDLTRPEAFHAAARVVVNGQDRPAFTLHTHPLPPAPHSTQRRPPPPLPPPLPPPTTQHPGPPPRLPPDAPERVAHAEHGTRN